jgi:hypothetical protein
MFTHRKRLAAAASAVALGAALVLAGASPAQAITGSLPPTSAVCTDKTRSDNGVSFYGFVGSSSNSSTIWSVRTSSSAAGPEAEVLRLPSGEPISTVLTWPGTLFYRLCLVQSAAEPLSGFRASVNVTPAGNPVYGIGPHTATLGAGGRFCGEVAAAPARLVGTSTTPVQWTVPVYDGDGLKVRTINLGTSTTVDQVITPGVDEFFTACVANTSAAVLSFDFVPA